MTTVRRAGILLHPTALPSRWGIGDLASVLPFLDQLAAARQQVWQVMPLGPTGYGDSPYQCFSTFAGNTLLIAPDQLIADGLLPAGAAADIPPFPADRVDYGAVIPFKHALLRQSFAQFVAHATPAQRSRCAAFGAANAGWLDDYALFAALKAAAGGASWDRWPRALARREPWALAAARQSHADELAFQRYAQWLFFEQWGDVRAAARARGIAIVGDVPIFVAYDSADVWANPAIFELDGDGQPIHVAGVPPDYFSATGQLWGNPLYRWDVLAQRGFDWWIARCAAALAVVDVVRLDHFRGFAGYWSVPAGAATAIDGRWLPGPGAALFDALRAALGGLPFIAEDLGLITPDVDALRLSCDLPGMRVLHFAFGGAADNAYLPHNYAARTVVYTGTHDNDTTRGWWRQAPPQIVGHVQRYLGRDGHDIAWDLIRAAWASVAELAVVPLQDVLDLGSEARMNTPGTTGGNWSWRVTPGALTPAHLSRLAELTEWYGRAPAAG